jgi:hypothetical protein
MKSRAARFRGVAFCLLAAVIIYIPQASNAALIYVKADAIGANDGSSWDDAYRDLQTALGAADTGDSVWVAVGTYKPTAGTSRTATFLMKNGVALFGGFVGVETSVSQRSMRFHWTVLSGEIGLLGKNDNSYHVLSAQSVDSTTILDGFYVTGGNASGGSPNDVGGGLTVVGGNPTVRNVHFHENSATRGGGVSLSGSRATLANVVLTGNFAAFGGGMYTYNSGHEVIVNTTFAGDSVQWQGAAFYNNGSWPQIVNSILWENKGITQVLNIGGAAATFSYSIVDGSGGSGSWNSIYGIDGGNNLDVDPLLWSVANGDVHLRTDSPAIGVGNNGAPGLPPTDCDGEPRIGYGTVDIGADEFGDPTAVGARTPTPRARITSVYPNPFNPTVTVSFDMDVRETVQVAVYDVGGRVIRSLLEGVRDPGPHRVTWDGIDRTGRRVASGVYFIEVETNAWRDHRKVILVK